MTRILQDDSADLAAGAVRSHPVIGPISTELSSGGVRSRPILGTISYVAAIWFGAGLSRIAPGTVATAATLPLYWLLRNFSISTQIASTLVFIALAIFFADRVARDMDSNDPQIIVIDEVAGALLALLILNNSSLIAQLSVLFAFRIFDIFKPGPINLNLPFKFPGIGIVYDDIAAGGAAGLLLLMVVRLFH